MSDYTTVDAVAAALNLTSTDYVTLQATVTATTSLIDGFCGRNFQPGTVGTVQYFTPADPWNCPIDDASAVTAVATDDGFVGQWQTAWTANTDYVLEPINRLGPAGQSGWPYTRICATQNRYFPVGGWRNNTVKVTGTFGWAAVPDPVQQAALFLAAEMFKAVREAPFGSANLSDFGPVLVRGNRRVADLLAPYKISTSSDGRYLVA